MTHPLADLTLDELRERTSVKWRWYPPDVLPAFVAEMDTPLAPPIAEALTTAVRRGDTGYATPAGLPEAPSPAATCEGDVHFDRRRPTPDARPPTFDR